MDEEEFLKTSIPCEKPDVIMFFQSGSMVLLMWHRSIFKVECLSGHHHWPFRQSSPETVASHFIHYAKAAPLETLLFWTAVAYSFTKAKLLKLYEFLQPVVWIFALLLLFKLLPGGRRLVIIRISVTSVAGTFGKIWLLQVCLQLFVVQVVQSHLKVINGLHIDFGYKLLNIPIKIFT